MLENAHILLFMPWTAPFSWRGSSRDTGSKYNKSNVIICFLPQESCKWGTYAYEEKNWNQDITFKN